MKPIFQWIRGVVVIVYVVLLLEVASSIPVSNLFFRALFASTFQV
jgi:hypothetical protein